MAVPTPVPLPADADPSLTVSQVRCDHLCVQSGLTVLARKRLPGVERPPSNSSIPTKEDWYGRSKGIRFAARLHPVP